MKVVIIGKSGQGKVAREIAEARGFEVIAMLDDDLGKKPDGPVSDFEKYIDNDTKFFIGIGNSKSREKVAKMLESKGARFITLIHPTAVVSPSCMIGEGTVVMANAVIGTDARIGNHCIINTAATIDHDNNIDDFAHISVGVHLGGTVNIGKHVWMGIGAIASNNVSICDGAFIGAGAVVVSDITEEATYIGVPARKIR